MFKFTPNLLSRRFRLQQQQQHTLFLTIFIYRRERTSLAAKRLRLRTLLFYSRLQKFKLNIANTVISQDNSSLSTMDTGQLLDLFSVDKEKRKEKTSAKQQNEGGKSSLKAMMENLGDLWDEEQYETEYNLDNFIGSLK